MRWDGPCQKSRYLIEQSDFQPLACHLAQYLQNVYVDAGFLAMLGHESARENGFNLLLHDLIPSPFGRFRMRRAHFGEALVCLIFREKFGECVPLDKLVFALDPDRSVPGLDVIFFQFENGRIIALNFVEVKTTTYRRYVRKAVEDVIAYFEDETRVLKDFRQDLQRIYVRLCRKWDPDSPELTEIVLKMSELAKDEGNRSHDVPTAHHVFFVHDEAVQADTLYEEMKVKKTKGVLHYHLHVLHVQGQRGLTKIVAQTFREIESFSLPRYDGSCDNAFCGWTCLTS